VRFLRLRIARENGCLLVCFACGLVEVNRRFRDVCALIVREISQSTSARCLWCVYYRMACMSLVELHADCTRCQGVPVCVVDATEFSLVRFWIELWQFRIRSIVLCLWNRRSLCYVRLAWNLADVSVSACTWLQAFSRMKQNKSKFRSGVVCVHLRDVRFGI
jgi:hypothetical protein